MPSFSVAAVDTSGKLIEELFTAPDRSAAVEIARERGLTPIRVAPAPGGAGAKAMLRRRGRSVPRGDLAFAFSQLGVLLKAGLELDRALAIVGAMLSRPATREELKALRQSLLEGRSLADHVAARAQIYPAFVAGAIRAGESSGALDVAFEQLGGMIARQIAVRQSIVNALIYPAFLILGSLASIIVLVVVVLPRFEPLFAQSGAQLPLPTRILMAVSSAAVDLAPAGIVLGLVLLLAGRSWIRKDANRIRWHGFLLSVPILGPTLLKAQIARFSMMMSALLKAGVPILSALGTSTQSATNASVARALERSAVMVRDGVALSQALAEQRRFPELFIQLLRVGEEAAKLDRSFLEVGEIYERDVAGDTQRLLALITPMTTIGLGLVIAGIIAAILSAVLRINDLALT